MTRRTKIIIGIVILALIALALWLALRGGERPEAVTLPNEQTVNTPSALPSGSTTLNVNSGTVPVVEVPPPPPPDPLLTLKRLAMAFAERYGSFSSLGSYENQLDLVPFMSADFAAATEAKVARDLAKPRATEYRGFTTRALVAEIDSLDETMGVAVVTVKTQRQEFTSPTGEGVVTYQDISLGFVKENDSWKVDSATWQ
jgi:hypothetical protein